jgi:hypothetical protein
MLIGLIVVAIVAMLALAIALGTSLGRQGDNEDELAYRHQMVEGMNQLDERLKKIEPDEPEDDDEPD